MEKGDRTYREGVRKGEEEEKQVKQTITSWFLLVTHGMENTIEHVYLNNPNEPVYLLSQCHTTVG